VPAGPEANRACAPHRDARARGLLPDIIALALALALVAIAGCAHPPASAPIVLRPPPVCDPARWIQAATTTHRAWLVSAAPSLRHRGRAVDPEANLAEAPLAVIDFEDDDVLLADIRPGAIVARWSPRTALGRAVIRETPVSARARVAGDPRVRVTAGYPLAAGGRDWIAVAPAEGVSITGWVPAATRGTIWEDAAPPPARVDHDALTVLREPQEEAAVVAGIAAGAARRVIGTKAIGGGWYEATIITTRAAIHGFVRPPPARPPIPPSPASSPSPASPASPASPSSAGSEDAQEIDLVTPARMPYPVGTCLRERPNGAIVGMIRGPLDVTPVRASGRWYAVVVPTVWGAVTLYVDGPPARPAPDDDAARWNFAGDDRWND
jgi:hypothetical protein